MSLCLYSGTSLICTVGYVICYSKVSLLISNSRTYSYWPLHSQTYSAILTHIHADKHTYTHVSTMLTLISIFMWGSWQNDMYSQHVQSKYNVLSNTPWCHILFCPNACLLFLLLFPLFSDFCIGLLHVYILTITNSKMTSIISVSKKVAHLCVSNFAAQKSIICIL